MAQNYTPQIAGTDYANAVLTTTIPANFEALRSCFSGASEPSDPVAFQLWADTSTGLLKIRTAGNSAWIVVAPMAASLVLPLPVEGWRGTVNATKTAKLALVPRAGTIKRLVMAAGAATTSSSGNEWRFQMVKYPASAPGSPVNLFSGNVGTFTALGGVGGGAEFAADTRYVLTPDQNAAVADGDLLELVVTKVGSVADLTEFVVGVDME